MKNIIIFLLLVSFFGSSAQQLTLEECIDSAIARYPLSAQEDIYNRILQTELKMLTNSNLPQVNLSAKATLQNQVISFPQAIPGMVFPELSKDQYRATLEISQSIYKGGLTKAQKELSRCDFSIDKAGNEVKLTQLKRTVISAYYRILLSREYLAVSKTYQNTLESKLDEMKARIEAGVLLPSAADVVKAEKLVVEQKITALESDMVSLIMQMEKLTGLKIQSSSSLLMPSPAINYSASQQRPEYKLLELKQQKLDALSSIYTAKSRPKAFAFSSLGVGRPGFDYLSNDFAPVALVGVGISWNLWNWGDIGKQKNILQLSVEIIENNKKSFVNDLNIKLLELRNEIEKEQKMLEKAQEISLLRKAVMETTDKQLKNGVVTASQYVDEVQKYEKARLDRQIHKVKLSLAKTNYLYALGLL